MRKRRRRPSSEIPSRWPWTRVLHHAPSIVDARSGEGRWPVTERRPIVIVGLPRSGTTWTMRALRTSPGAIRVPEPDNEDNCPAAIHAKAELGRYPCLEPGQEHSAYRQLWEWILSGAPKTWRFRQARRILGRGSSERIFDGDMDLSTRLAAALARNPRPNSVPPGRVVAKSIHAQLSIEWIADEFEITPLILLRHPASVLASWMEVQLKDGRNSTLESRPEVRAHYAYRWDVPPPGPDPIEKMSWRIGLLVAALEEVLTRHPEWHVRTHEQLCTDPVAAFRQLFTDLDLPWGDDTEPFLVEFNAPGKGFSNRRVASELSDSWQKRLTDDQLHTLRRTLARFPITNWTDDDFERTAPGG